MLLARLTESPILRSLHPKHFLHHFLLERLIELCRILPVPTTLTVPGTLGTILSINRLMLSWIWPLPCMERTCVWRRGSHHSEIPLTSLFRAQPLVCPLYRAQSNMDLPCPMLWVKLCRRVDRTAKYRWDRA